MRCLAVHRCFAAVAVGSVAISTVAFGSSAAAVPLPSAVPVASTTAFQIPVTFRSGCGVGFRCYVPTLALITPSATAEAPGSVTFTTGPPSTISITTIDCIDVTVNWRNLTTGDAGTTEIRRVPRDYSRAQTPDEWCRYVPATVSTGGGIVTATADVVASAQRSGDHVPVSSGFGVFQVP
jgi:hypothetical protein